VGSFITTKLFVYVLIYQNAHQFAFCLVTVHCKFLETASVCVESA